MSKGMIKLSKIKPNPDNPRVIKDENFEKLCKSIKEFPKMMALRPIIVREDWVVLGGNMRRKALESLGYEKIPEEWVKSADDFTEEEQKRFLVTDNIGFGEWDWEILQKDWDVSALTEWNLNVPIDKMIDGMDEEDDELEFEQSVQIEPADEYIMIIAPPNSPEWDEIKERLKLGIVRRGGYKKGSPFDASSIERVIKWDDFKKRYDVDSDTE